jgi:hypothetical protein
VGAAAPAVPMSPLLPPKFGIGGRPIFSWESGYSTGTIPATGSNNDNSVTVIVEGNILDGDDFTDKMNRAMLDSIRRGLSQMPAGALP